MDATVERGRAHSILTIHAVIPPRRTGARPPAPGIPLQCGSHGTRKLGHAHRVHPGRRRVRGRPRQHLGLSDAGRAGRRRRVRRRLPRLHPADLPADHAERDRDRAPVAALAGALVRPAAARHAVVDRGRRGRAGRRRHPLLLLRDCRLDRGVRLVLADRQPGRGAAGRRRVLRRLHEQRRRQRRPGAAGARGHGGGAAGRCAPRYRTGDAGDDAGAPGAAGAACRARRHAARRGRGAGLLPAARPVAAARRLGLQRGARPGVLLAQPRHGHDADVRQLSEPPHRHRGRRRLDRGARHRDRPAGGVHHLPRRLLDRRLRSRQQRSPA